MRTPLQKHQDREYGRIERAERRRAKRFQAYDNRVNNELNVCNDTRKET